MILNLVLGLLLVAPPPDLVARGIVLSRNEGRSVALLAANNRTRVALVGESAFGGKVLRIENDSVVMLFGEESVTVPLTSGRGGAAIATPARSTAPMGNMPPAVEDPATPPRAMSRPDLDRRISTEMNRILSETALQPVMEDGRVKGVFVSRIADGSLLTDVGLRKGDVITNINGTNIDSLATLLSLYTRLQGAKELRAVVVRGGQATSLQLSIK
ncbi:MAG: PDZ domain-containing protein [Vicinamibacteria bacterium]|jgi:general secretion pathway protein C|nr:PDZ domain-containing protein [Vicinamibacteria bacterium]